MAYIFIILFTILLALPKLLFRNMDYIESGLHPNTEFTVGFPMESSTREKAREIYTPTPSSWNEPDPQLENWMMDLSEWDLISGNKPEGDKERVVEINEDDSKTLKKSLTLLNK